MAAVFAGVGALAEIYTAGLKGFTLIKGKTMTEVMKMAAGNIQKGLSLGSVNLQGLAQNVLFTGTTQIGKQMLS